MILDSKRETEIHLSGLAQRVSGNTVDAAARLFEAIGESQERGAFVARALDALVDITEQVDESALLDAVGAPSSLAALLQVLERPDTLGKIRLRDPLISARIRGLQAQEWMLGEHGGTLSAEQVGKALGITRQAVDQRRKKGALIGLQLGRHGYAYPSWQVGSRGTLPGLAAVLDELRDETPWAQAAFFLASNVWLDGDTPLETLHRGETERVREAAHHLGDQVAV